jgi:hypothetical protein
MMIWKLLHPRATYEMLGFLPEMLSDLNPKLAREQFNDQYRHGGGWQPFNGHNVNLKNLTLTYPGDPPMRAIGETTLRDERVILFEGEWVAIIQKDGSFEIARMD